MAPTPTRARTIVHKTRTPFLLMYSSEESINPLYARQLRAFVGEYGLVKLRWDLLFRTETEQLTG